MSGSGGPGGSSSGGPGRSTRGGQSVVGGPGAVVGGRMRSLEGRVRSLGAGCGRWGPGAVVGGRVRSLGYTGYNWIQLVYNFSSGYDTPAADQGRATRACPRESGERGPAGGEGRAGRGEQRAIRSGTGTAFGGQVTGD
jgi:hypothetical protein